MDRSIKLLLSALLCATVAKAETRYYDTVTWDFGSSLIVNSGITAKFMPGSTVDATGATLVGFPGGSGASSFLGLVDTPSSYTGQAGNFVAVNPGASGLIFVPAPTGGGGGTVTNFTAGNLSPLFNTSVTNPSTTPTLAFSLSNVGAGLFWGNETGVTAAPHYVQPSFANLSGDFALTQTPSLAAGSLIGRTSTGAGDWQPITVGTGLSLVGTTLSGAIGGVFNSGPPVADQLPIWVDATHIKGVRGLTGGTTGQVLKKNSNTDYDYVWAADLIGGSSGSSSFITLTDVPSTYAGSGGKLVAVNITENGLEFIAAPSGGGSVTSVFGRTGVVTALVGDYSAFYQPLDTDLTSIATLTTTTFGRGFLTLADATSSRSYIGAGTSNFDGTWTSLTGKPTTLAGFGITDAQPLDADLTAIAALSGLNTVYYRSAANTWSAITFGSNMTWGSGTLNAANTNWDTAFTDRMKWDGGATGLVAATGRTSLGLNIGTNVQAWDADLDSLASAASTNAIYYRNAANTWSPVTVGTGLSFSGGSLTSTGGGDVSSNTAVSVDGEVALFNLTTGKSIKRAVGSGVATLSSGVLGTITDNSTNWNTAFTDRMKWDGGATGLVAATGRTSLALNNVTNDAQTQAAVMPNTAPTAGQIPVGSGTSYVPRTVSGSGATVTMGSTGIVSISAIPNVSLNNSSITVGAAPATTLGGAVSLDSLSGITGAIGLIKRAGSGSNWAIAVAGTDYKVGTQNTINIRMVTATGTFTPTAGVTALYFEGVGGGGGGASSYVANAAYGGGGGGGGGGGYAAAYVATPAASYSITIGVGGSGGVATANNPGGNGGDTTVGTILTAGGGAGGGASNGGYYMTFVTALGGDGGVGTIGGLLTSGSDGGIGVAGPYTFTAPSTFTGNGYGGNGGSSMFGGGAKVPAQSTAGNVGGKYGGGGSGASMCGCSGVGGRAGGAGFAGIVRVWEIF